MQGRDMIGRARTGTGKTLAFGIPIMDKIIQFNAKHGLVLFFIFIFCYRDTYVSLLPKFCTCFSVRVEGGLGSVDRKNHGNVICVSNYTVFFVIDVAGGGGILWL